RWFAMGSPASMANACSCSNRLGGCKLFQCCHFTLSFIDLDRLSGMQCNPRTIITTVLQFFQSFNQDGVSLVLACIADDSAHKVAFYLLCGCKNSIFVVNQSI